MGRHYPIADNYSLKCFLVLAIFYFLTSATGWTCVRDESDTTSEINVKRV